MKINLVFLLIFALLLIGSGLMFYKIFVLQYHFEDIIPDIRYDVEFSMSTVGFGDDIRVETFLPTNDERQNIQGESYVSGIFDLKITDSNWGRSAVWQAKSVKGKQEIKYLCSVHAKHIKYKIDKSITIPQHYPASLSEYLKSTEAINLQDPVILKKFKQLITPKMNLLETIEAIYKYALSLKFLPFKGLTSASTAVRLGEASCNGKSRTFVALARLAGIPARLVGGVILKSGTKKISHQWVEVYINGYWVPFDALNNHFAEIPENYLSLYYGDFFLFKHTPNINFNYLFNIKKHLSFNENFMKKMKSTPFNAYSIWMAFKKIGVSMDLLLIIIMIPLGVTVIVVFRNVIGFDTFGTFLPALIATACRGTGLFWGLVSFVIIIGIVALLHLLLDKLSLLHTPKLSIMLTVVIILMFSLTVLGVKTELFALAHISLFPIAILAITSERFSLLITEEGWERALKVSLMTLIVISVAYFAINSLVMQVLFLSFPELLLLLIILNFWLGKWIGLRLTEYKRFRWLVNY